MAHRVLRPLLARHSKTHVFFFRLPISLCARPPASRTSGENTSFPSLGSVPIRKSSSSSNIQNSSSSRSSFAAAATDGAAGKHDGGRAASAGSVNPRQETKRGGIKGVKSTLVQGIMALYRDVVEIDRIIT